MTGQEKAIIAASNNWLYADEAGKDEITACFAPPFSYDSKDNPVVAAIYNKLRDEIMERTAKKAFGNTTEPLGGKNGRAEKTLTKKDPLPCLYTTHVDPWTYQRLMKLNEGVARNLSNVVREIIFAEIDNNTNLQKPLRARNGTKNHVLSFRLSFNDGMQLQAAADKKGWPVGTFCQAIIETEIRRREKEEREKSGQYSFTFTTNAQNVRALQRYARYVGKYPSQILDKLLVDFLGTTEIPTEEQAAEAEEKRRIEKENAHPTEKQKRYIWVIQNELGVEFDGTTKEDARRWINAHQAEFEKAQAARNESKERGV